MNKTIIAILLILVSISGVSATYEQINDSLYIYNSTKVSFTANEGQNTNIEKVIVDGGVCTKMKISTGIISDYEFDYDLNWAPNETMYYTTILTLKQEEIDNSWYGLYKTIKRTLYIDAVEVASYNTTTVLNAAKMNSVEFVSIDKRIVFGSKVVNNATLFFSELTTQDQYDYLYNNSGDHVKMSFTTSDVAGRSFESLRLGGLVGIFMRGVKLIPLIGSALYNVIYPVALIMQYTIDFSFLIINLIIYDWWYALMLLEIACLFVATSQTGYVNILSAYINTHVSITMFIYHKIVIPLLDRIMSLLKLIRG